MKRLKFKKPFNGMDNAKKLIPESYKVDGNEFEITDGNETYRVKWSSLINEGIVLTSSNKAQINEDMSKIKHLMGFKSQDTLGTVKGAARLDENKKFGDVLGKTKNLLNEEANENLELKSLAKKIYLEFKNMGARVSLTDANTVKDIGAERGDSDNADVFVYINNDRTFGDTVGVILVGDKAIGEKDKIKNSFKEFEFTERQGGDTWKGKKTVHLTIRPGKSVSENEHIKSGMGGSNKGKSRTDKTEVLKNDSKKKRRKSDKEATKDINENDVENFQDALGSNPKVVNAAKKLNTPIEKIEAAVKFINSLADDDDALIGKIIRAIRKDDSDAVNEFDEDESEDYYDFDDTTTSIEGEPGYNQSDINPIDTDLLSQIDSPNTMAGRKARKAGKSDVQKDYSQPKKGIHPLDPRKHALPYDLDSYGPDDLPSPPSEEEEQSAQIYEDRFDEVFEGMYEDDDMYESEETMDGPIPSDPYQANENSNNELISQVKSRFGLGDLIFRITVDTPEEEYRGGNGTLYVYAEKGEDSVEFEFNVESDLDYEGAPQDLYINGKNTNDNKNYPEYVKFITQFITPEAYKELEDNIDIEVT